MSKGKLPGFLEEDTYTGPRSLMERKALWMDRFNKGELGKFTYVKTLSHQALSNHHRMLSSLEASQRVLLKEMREELKACEARLNEVVEERLVVEVALTPPSKEDSSTQRKYPKALLQKYGLDSNAQLDELIELRREELKKNDSSPKG